MHVTFRGTRQRRLMPDRARWLSARDPLLPLGLWLLLAVRSRRRPA
jgi:hypothetical protein